MLRVVERQKGESVGVIEIALLGSEEKKDDGADDEAEAHEDLQYEDIHGVLSDLRSDHVVARTVDSELKGMSTAHASGVMRPANANVIVTAL